MSDYEHLLSVQDLHTTFTTDNGEVHATRCWESSESPVPASR